MRRLVEASRVRILRLSVAGPGGLVESRPELHMELVMTTRGCSWIPVATRRLIRSWRIPHRTPRSPRRQLLRVVPDNACEDSALRPCTRRPGSSECTRETAVRAHGPDNLLSQRLGEERSVDAGEAAAGTPATCPWRRSSALAAKMARRAYKYHGPAILCAISMPSVVRLTVPSESFTESRLHPMWRRGAASSM